MIFELEKKANALQHVVDSLPVPKLIECAGKSASHRFLEFFAAHLRNRGTRIAYANAVARFLSWCDGFGVALEQITPFIVATYIEQLNQSLKPPTVKQHLAAIRSLFDFLVTGQIVPFNPAAAVRGPRYVVKNGKTPVLSAEQARQLLDGIDLNTISGLRDRALVGMMVYSFARVSAAIGMNVGDFFDQGGQMWFRLHEKGSKHHEVPVHHKAERYMHEYLDSAGIRDQARGPLFRTVGSKRGLTLNRMHRVDVYRMIRRRASQVGLSTNVCCHTFRATGITVYLQCNGQLEHAQRLAAHESIRSTKLYDRTLDAVSSDEVERIRI